MRLLIVTAGLATAILALSSYTLPQEAQAKGCIKGAVVGGIAGHVVHHGAMGAVIGCFAGMHDAHKAAAMQNQPPVNRQPNGH